LLQQARYRACPDVPGDVIDQVPGLESQIAERCRNTIARVIADEDDALHPAALDHLAGGRLVRCQ
jgi:hypothetical protein